MDIKLVFIICFIMNACVKKQKDNGGIISDSANIIFDEFPLSFDLEGRFVGPEDFFGIPEALVFVGDRVVVYDSKTSNLFHILDSAFSWLHSDVTTGRGSMELEGIVKIMGSGQEDRAYVELYEYDRFVTKLFFSDHTLTSFDSMSKLELPSELYNFQSMDRLAGYGYVAMGGMREGKICVLNKNDFQYHFFPYTPDFQMKGHPGFEYYYNGDMTMINDSMFVCVHNQIKEVEIYSIDDGVLQVSRYGDMHNPFQDSNMFYYLSVDSDEEYIYACYLGMDMNSPMNLISRTKSSVHVFTHEGMPVADLKLDQLVDRIYVGPTKHQLVAICSDCDRKNIVIYDLESGILDRMRASKI